MDILSKDVISIICKYAEFVKCSECPNITGHVCQMCNSFKCVKHLTLRGCCEPSKGYFCDMCSVLWKNHIEDYGEFVCASCEKFCYNCCYGELTDMVINKLCEECILCT